jgi:hypothetical protein
VSKQPLADFTRHLLWAAPALQTVPRNERWKESLQKAAQRCEVVLCTHKPQVACFLLLQARAEHRPSPLLAGEAEFTQTEIRFPATRSTITALPVSPSGIAGSASDR